MRVLALIYLVAIGCVNAISNIEVLEKWKIYQEQFSKTYRSTLEYRKRLEIFNDNLRKIEDHNALYEQGKTNHTEGINQFTDWTKEEFLQYVNKGLLVDKPVFDGEVFNNTGNFKLSDFVSVDWRASGVVTDVKNQGKCGASWSFSSTGAIEGQLGRKGRIVSLSEQNLIDCSKNYGNNGCEGGISSLAFSYVKDHGIESEQNYPYRALDGYCNSYSPYVVTKVSGLVGLPPGNEADLQIAIASIGPIAVTIDATENLQRYSGGILWDDSCNSQRLNHGALAVGYGRENGQDFYIVKNSWGSTWGEAGYFRFPINQNMCGISNEASYPVL